MCAGLGVSRALLSEAFESDETGQCLPSGLGTATMECVQGEVGAGKALKHNPLISH